MSGLTGKGPMLGLATLAIVAIAGCGTDDQAEQADQAAERAAEREERQAERQARERAREARERRRQRQARREARAAAEAEATEPEPEAEPDCTPGYDPCLPPASDYDCKDGTGDGPEYTGEVRVTGADPYDLDRDGNGIGCEGQLPAGPVR